MGGIRRNDAGQDNGRLPSPSLPAPKTPTAPEATTYLEQVNGSSGVQRRLLVDGGNNSALLGLGGVQGGSQVELQTLGDLVLQLDLSSQQVGSGPCLGEDNAVLEVDVLALDVTSDGSGLGVSGTGDLEGGRV